MDNRGYGSSGYSSWGGGGGSSSSRGSGGYDLYGYKDSMSSSGGYGGGYGGGMGSGQMKRGLSGAGMVSTGTSADAVIAKINQRLDMLTQLEGSGSMKGGGRTDRFDQYESYDSRPSSVNPRDLYRSGSYGYGEGPSDLRGGGGYGGSAYDGSAFAPAKARQPRESYSSPGWGGGRSPRRGGAPGGPGGRGFGRRQEPPMGGGGGLVGARGGHSPRGRGRLPSLLSHRMYPETGAYQPPLPGPQDLSSGRPFGMGPGIRAGRQRGRKRPVNRFPTPQINPQREVQKKRKQTVTPGDEPESKMGKTETENTESTNDSTQPSGETSEAKSSTPAKAKADDDALTMQEEINQMKKKLQTKPPSPPQDRFPKMRKRRGFQERVMFACSVCKFRSFYTDEMAAHMESRFHKDHFRFLANQLTKPTIDFLQEYLNNKWKKTEERTKQVDNISAAICQVYRDQDLTRDIGMEHFMKKVEAAHCAACDLFIPMQPHLIQRHLKSPDHNFNRKGLMEQSKHASLSVARSILNHKVIAKKLECYLKGENPFNGNDKDPEDSMMDVSGAELEKSQATEDGEGDSNHAHAGEGQNDGAEMKMEGEELEGVPGEDCLEREEEGNEGGAGLKEKEAGTKEEEPGTKEEEPGTKEEEAGNKEEAEVKADEAVADEAVPNEEQEEALLGEEEGEEGIEGDLGDGEEQGVEGEIGDGEEGIDGDLGEDDEGVEDEEGVEVDEGVPGMVDDEEQGDDVAVVEDDDDGVVLVE